MSNRNEQRPSSGRGGRRGIQPQPQGEPRKNSAPRRRKRRRPLLLTLIIRLFQLLGTLILIGCVTCAFLACYAGVYIQTVILPDTELDLSAYTLDENSVIYYQDKNTGLYTELATLVGDKNTEWVDYEDIPKDLINAVVAIEDKTFWTHQGVNWKRTGGALLNMFLSMKDTYGGSTITQQLIKNVTQYDDVTVKRKILEIFTALELEKNYDKDEILELYLNVIYLGDKCYGVQSAAQHYFGKSVSELSLEECASLAGITNNPSIYSPTSNLKVTRYQCSKCDDWTSEKDLETCESCGAERSYSKQGIVWTAKDYNKYRQELILAEMAKEENGYITQAEAKAAAAKTLSFSDGSSDEEEGETDSNYNSWYVDAVIKEVIADLMEETGLDKRMVTTMVYSGGLSIYTNYDPDIQAAVDEIYTNRENLDKRSDSGQQIKSAITIVDNSTGYVVAMAGDVGEKVGNRIWNNAVDSLYQPGSSFKPLSVYAPAIEMGLITPATIIDDNPMLLEGEDGEEPSVWPRNDGASYKGLTTIQTGVGRSLNTIAVRTLQKVTPEVSYQFLTERFGLTSLVDHMVLQNGQVKSDIDESPLAMGGLTKGVSTFEMAAAFATFPRNGTYTEPTTYLKVENIDHEVILDNTPKDTQVIKESTAYYMNQLLYNAVQSGTGTPAKISGMSVAGKTGTTNDSFARWFAGYTPYYTGVVWVGYEYNESIKGFSKNPAVTMWQKVMSLIHEDLEDTGFVSNVTTVEKSVCLDCGNLAIEGVCTNDIRGSRAQTFTFVEGDEPVEVCTCHVAVDICTESFIPDENGEPTTHNHLAGEYCPVESVQTVYVVDYQRELVTEPTEIEDYYALKSFYDTMEAPYCTVHTTVIIDPTDPNSPYYDPYYDPNNPYYDPNYDPNDPGGTEEDPWWSWPDWSWPWGSDEEDQTSDPPAEESDAGGWISGLFNF